LCPSDKKVPIEDPIKHGDIRLSGASLALGNIGDPRAVPALIEALKDEDEYVRSYAASALGKIGKPAVPALIEALKHEDKTVRWSAAFSLDKIGEPAVPVLIEALKHGDKFIRGYAAWILGRMGTPEALKAVKEYQKQRKDEDMLDRHEYPKSCIRIPIEKRKET
jgi:HEAT repeat protein